MGADRTWSEPIVSQSGDRLWLAGQSNAGGEVVLIVEFAQSPTSASASFAFDQRRMDDLLEAGIDVRHAAFGEPARLKRAPGRVPSSRWDCGCRGRGRPPAPPSDRLRRR
jgi:hypothetical protein